MKFAIEKKSLRSPYATLVSVKQAERVCPDNLTPYHWKGLRVPEFW